MKENNKEDEVLEYITDKKGGFESFDEVLDTMSEKTLITAINNADFWNQVQEVVENNDDYFTLKNIPTKVWKDVCDDIPFETIDEFEKRCNESKSC